MSWHIPVSLGEERQNNGGKSEKGDDDKVEISNPSCSRQMLAYSEITFQDGPQVPDELSIAEDKARWLDMMCRNHRLEKRCVDHIHVLNDVIEWPGEPDAFEQKRQRVSDSICQLFCVEFRERVIRLVVDNLKTWCTREREVLVQKQFEAFECQHLDITKKEQSVDIVRKRQRRSDGFPLLKVVANPSRLWNPHKVQCQKKYLNDKVVGECEKLNAGLSHADFDCLHINKLKTAFIAREESKEALSNAKLASIKKCIAHATRRTEELKDILTQHREFSAHTLVLKTRQISTYDLVERKKFLKTEQRSFSVSRKLPNSDLYKTYPGVAPLKQKEGLFHSVYKENMYKGNI
jgi:hypothetical protein